MTDVAIARKGSDELDASGKLDESQKRRKQLGKDLCEAASEGDLEQLRKIMDSGADANAADYDKRSAMHLASAEGHLAVVQFLVERQADINIKDRWGGYPLKEAVFNGHVEVRDFLILKGAEIDPKDEEALSQELCKASAKGDVDTVSKLLECHAGVNSLMYDGRSALHLASAEGHLTTVKLLLSKKANVRAKDRWGADALKDAMRGNHMPVVQVLKEHGALGLTDEHSDHSMTMGEKMCNAASKGDLEEIKRLVAKGASVNACDYDRRSALHLAAAEGHDEVVAFLVIYGANVNCKDRWGGDPLKDAIRGGHSQVQSILREAGGRGDQDDHSDHKDHGDRMCNAASKGDLQHIKFLVSMGASVNAADYDRRSALHLASAEGHHEVVEFLVQCGADVHCKDRWGGTPLKDAIRGGHTEVSQVLMDAGAGTEGKMEQMATQLEVEGYAARPLHLRAKTEQWSVDRAEVKMGKLLGEGQQGYVLRADWRGMPVVCKVLKNRDSHTDDLDFQNEISVLSHLRHPNLVLFLGACLDGEPKIIVSEFLDGGSLEDMYDKRRAEKGYAWRPPCKMVHMWAVELGRALCFLHNCSPPVIHRDLKPGNLLLTAEGHLKVSDFGLSKIIDIGTSANGTYRMTGVTGTLRYMAPEVVRSEGYNEKVDVYSYAFVIWFMCTGERPLANKVQADFLGSAQRHEAMRPDLRCITFRPLAELMHLAWDDAPAVRPTAAEAVEKLQVMKLPSNPREKAASKKLMSGKQCACM
mmetsp:Transcript_62463/g.147282  ORF Transcript_62463/g.147282 Transcript_62463/m.147282 type:complete len:757 (+) Transcript_62463:310-2580(+)